MGRRRGSWHVVGYAAAVVVVVGLWRVTVAPSPDPDEAVEATATTRIGDGAGAQSDATASPSAGGGSVSAGPTDGSTDVATAADGELDPSALGRYDELADVFVAPDGDGDGTSPARPTASIQDALVAAGPGGVVELAPGHYGDVEIEAIEGADDWDTPVTLRAEQPADWREAWRIVAEEDYVLDDAGEVAAATFEGLWSSTFGSFRSWLTNLQVVGFGIERDVSLRDARVEFDQIVSAAPGNRWYPRSDFAITRSVLAWPVSVESGDRLQIAGEGAGRTALVDTVMLGNVFRLRGSDGHSDSLQTLTEARVVVRRSAILAAANRIQLSEIGPDSLFEDTYIEAQSDAARVGYFIPPSSDGASTGNALMADERGATLRRVEVLGGINDSQADSPFVVENSRIRYYGGDLDTWTGSTIEDGSVERLPDGAGNRRGIVDPRRPVRPASW